MECNGPYRPFTLIYTPLHSITLRLHSPFLLKLHQKLVCLLYFFIESLYASISVNTTPIGPSIELTAAEGVIYNLHPIGDLIGLVLTENEVYKDCHYTCMRSSTSASSYLQIPYLPVHLHVFAGKHAGPFLRTYVHRA